VVPVDTPAPPAAESPPAPHTGPLTYTVIDAYEEPVLNGVRVVMRVRLSRDASESELRGIGELIIQSESARRRLSAIALVYYLGGAAVADACAVGRAVWAPNGDWDATRTVRLGDYASHRHVVAGGTGTTRFPRECGADGRR
jgi:hypothetical protein